jgi:MSV199 domain
MYVNGQNISRHMIQKALDKGLGMLPINKFIDVVNFQLNQVLPLGIMWNSFQRNIPIYATDDLIKVFGYKGPLLVQKKSLLKSIKRFKLPIINFDNNEYTKNLLKQMNA